MTPRVVAAILRKDLRSFGRDRFFLYMTILGLVAYAVIYFLLPSSVDESVTLGVHQSGIESIVDSLGANPGLDMIEYDTRDALAEAVQGGGPVAGLSFPEGFADALRGGEPVTVEVLVPAGMPGEIGYLVEGMVDQIAAAVSGDFTAAAPMIEIAVLGTDRVGNQVSLREQMRPLLAFLILMVETLALASLVASEVQAKTVVAVLATPATFVDFLAAKTIFGTALAFSEAGLLMAVIGGLSGNPLLVLFALLLGAVLVTGLGMVAGSFGRDFMSVLFISMVFMLPLMIPAFGVLFPGSPALWVKALPSYGLVDAIVGVTTNGEGWSDVAPSLLLLAGWCVVLFGAGIVTLRRRVAAL